MTWRDKLRAASFRGVPFFVESDDLSAGRRVQVHEYPQRDKPFAEDLGRATREIALSAFLVGPDFMAARDRLLGAMETPGPGTLVHPWYGSMQVVAQPARVRHSRADGGYCQIDMAFVEAGELTFPSAASATDARSRRAAVDLDGASLDDFAASFNVTGVPDFVRDSALAQITGGLSSARAVLGGLAGEIDGLVSAVTGAVGDLLDDPRALAGTVLGLFSDVAALANTPARLVSTFRALLTFASLPSFAHASSSYATPARLREQTNNNTVRALYRRAALAQAAQASAGMSVTVRDDAVAQRDQLAAAIDAETLTASDAAFPALTDLRVAVWRDMSERSRDAARLRTVTPPAVVPAVVLAYDLYETADRDAEIVARNRVPHPGFMPAAPLQVLSR